MQHPSDLKNVAVVVAFSGWNDAGNAASDSVLYLLDNYPSREIARIEDERFYDFQASRPQVRRTDDGPVVQWPFTAVHLVSHEERDILCVVGPEPSLLWRTYGQELVDLLKGYEPEVVVLLGAMLSDTPHSRPLPVGMYSHHQWLQEQLDVEPSSYEGPTGILGVVGQMLQAESVPALSIWVSVPHYVATPPNPKAQHTLISRLETVLGMELELGDLPDEATNWTKAVDELSSEDPDVAEYIEQLEEAKDASDVEDATGENIAKEFERYLKGRRDRG